MPQPSNDSLARAYSQPNASFQDSASLLDSDNSSLLGRQLSRIAAYIQDEGLNSLLWVSGIHTMEIATSLLETLAGQVEAPQQNTPNTSCIVVKPGEIQLIEPFNSQYGCSLRRMQEFYDDSFVIVNEAAVLDVTPVATDDGDPEFTDDPTVVSLYIGLFNMLKNRSNPV